MNGEYGEREIRPQSANQRKRNGLRYEEDLFTNMWTKRVHTNHVSLGFYMLSTGSRRLNRVLCMCVTNLRVYDPKLSGLSRCACCNMSGTFTRERLFCLVVKRELLHVV